MSGFGRPPDEDDETGHSNFRRVMIVDVLDELVGGPLLLAVLFCEAEFADWMAVESSLVFNNHGVMSVDPH